MLRQTGRPTSQNLSLYKMFRNNILNRRQQQINLLLQSPNRISRVGSSAAGFETLQCKIQIVNDIYQVSINLKKLFINSNKFTS